MFPNVYGASVACPTSHLQPGVVQAWSTPVTGLLDVGRYPTGIDQVSEAVAADFRAATFSSYPVQDISYPVQDIRRWKNRKLLTNLGNAIQAVCGPHERQGPLGTRSSPRAKRCFPPPGSKPLPRRKTGTDGLIFFSSARSQGRPGPVSPHGKACGALPATSRRTTSMARSCYSAGYIALRHQPTNCCNDLHESFPSPEMRPARLPQRRSWSDSKRPERQLTLRSFEDRGTGRPQEALIGGHMLR